MFKSRWWVVVASFFALIVGQGAVEVFCTGVFIKPLSQELHLGRGVISSAMGLANITTAIMIIFLGRMMDRYGVRPVLLPFLVLFAAVTASLSLLTSSVALLMFMFALQGVVGSGQTPTAYSKMVTARFDDHRGLALGLALAGVGVGTAFLPQYARYLLQHWGWRGGYVGIGIAIMVLSFIPVALWFGETPELRAARLRKAEAAHTLPGLEFSEAIRTGKYWAVCFAFFFGLTAINGTLIHTVPMLTDRGIPIGAAVGAMTGAGLALIVGRIIAGFLLDKIFAPYIVIFFLLCPMAGIGILALRVGGLGPTIGPILLGMGVGAEIDLIAFIISRYFGIKAFGAMHGLTFAFALMANAVGNNLLGWSFQLKKSYAPGLAIMEILLAISIIILARLGPYRFPALKPAQVPKVQAVAGGR
jgi:MFS family permease